VQLSPFNVAKQHLLSGVHKTVTTASGIFCAAISLQRGQARLGHVGGR